MGKSSSPQTMNTLTPEQNLVSQALGKILHNQLGKPTKGYKGDIVAPLDPGYDVLEQMIDSYNPNAHASGTGDALEQLLGGHPAYDLDPAVMEAYFRDAVAAPALRNFQQNVVPQLNAAYAGQGAAFSTRLSQAKGQALDNLNADLAAQMAQTNQAAQTTRAQLADSAAARRVQGVQLAQQQALAPLTQATLLGQALSPIQQQKQGTATANYNEWLRKQPANNPYMQLALSYMGQSPNAVYTPQPDPMTGAYTGAAGGALSGALAGSAGGPIGAIIGGLVGAASGGFSGYGQ
jgi:hypothetical protein